MGMGPAPLWPAPLWPTASGVGMTVVMGSQLLRKSAGHTAGLTRVLHHLIALHPPMALPGLIKCGDAAVVDDTADEVNAFSVMVGPVEYRCDQLCSSKAKWIGEPVPPMGTPGATGPLAHDSALTSHTTYSLVMLDLY